MDSMKNKFFMYSKIPRALETRFFFIYLRRMCYNSMLQAVC